MYYQVLQTVPTGRARLGCDREEQACRHEHPHRHARKELPYDLKTATVSFGSRARQPLCHLWDASPRPITADRRIVRWRATTPRGARTASASRRRSPTFRNAAGLPCK